MKNSGVLTRRTALRGFGLGAIAAAGFAGLIGKPTPASASSCGTDCMYWYLLSPGSCGAPCPSGYWCFQQINFDSYNGQTWCCKANPPCSSYGCYSQCCCSRPYGRPDPPCQC